MKNYKKLAEEFIKKADCKCVDWIKCNCSSTVRSFAIWLNSLPDQEPKECEHEWKLNEGVSKPTEFCNKCGVDKRLVDKEYKPKDLPKLPDRVEINNTKTRDGTLTDAFVNQIELADKINQILDYLKNK